MSIKYDFNAALSDVVGARDGLTVKALQSLAPKARKIHEDLVAKRQNGTLGFFDLPFDDGLVSQIKKFAKGLKKYENFVVLGIGGSGLGPVCVHTALTHTTHLTSYSRDCDDFVQCGLPAA